MSLVDECKKMAETLSLLELLEQEKNFRSLMVEATNAFDAHTEGMKSYIETNGVDPAKEFDDTFLIDYNRKIVNDFDTMNVTSKCLAKTRSGIREYLINSVYGKI